MFERSSINQAVNSVYKVLQNQLIKTYKIDVEESEKITDELLKIHGMGKEDFSVIDKIETLITHKLNDVSVDDNSNKSEKTVKGIMKEALAPFEKMAGYRFLYRTMDELYGKKEAKHLTSLMYDFTLGLADSTNILVPYCWAFDASKIVTMGKPFGHLPSSPVKRLDSYVSLLNEVIHTMSNHLAGAIAIGTFFIDIAHLLIVNEKKTIEDLKDKNYRKYIINQYQRVVHGFNSLSRSGGTESPFTNVSLFDRIKLEKLIKEEYAWYFMEEGKEIDYDYIIEFIIELQNIFMEFFDKGDPLNDGMPYRFPVCFPGDESVIINNNIVSFEEQFGNYNKGWTDVKNLNLFTEYLDNNVKINSVYVGESREFIELDGYGIGKKIRVTPDHKFYVEEKGLICAKDLSLKDRILWHKFDKINNVSDVLDTEEILLDLWTLGYKLKYSANTKKLVIDNKGKFKSNSLDSYNHNKSHPSSLIRECEEDIFEFPEVVYVKTEKSKQKGAIRKKIDLNFDFGFLCGLFYSEGHISKGEIGFSFHKKEKDLINFINDYINYIVKDVSIRNQYSKDSESMQIIFNSETLTLLLKYIVRGDKAQNKYFNIEFLNKYSNEQFYEGILLGCIAGDGHVNKYSCSQTTISKKGAESIQYLSRKLGVASVIKNVQESTCEFNGKSYLSKHQYVIDFCKKDIINIMSMHNTYCEKFSILTVGQTALNSRSSFIVRRIEKTTLNSPIKVFNIEVDNEEHLFTLPCGIITSNCTLNIAKKKDKDGKWVIEDKKFLKSACKKDIYRYNIFVSEGNKVASCCRLLSDQDKMELASQSNSFGAGGSISLGSHRVISINFARLALMSKTKEEFFELIKIHTINCKKILRAHKKLMKDSEKAQQFLQLGWIQLDRMFSTLGIMGYVEAEYIMKKKFKELKNIDFMKEFLDYFNNEVDTNNEDFPECFFNIEQIPGESMCHRLPRADKLIFGDKNIPFEIYANQFVPLWEQNQTVWYKMATDGKYLSDLTGGGISHINTGEHVTPKQAENLIDFAVESNCEHFAITGTFSQCEKGHVLIGDTKFCNKCGEPIKRKIARVVGFFVDVDDMSFYKKEFDHDQRKQYSNGDFDVSDIQKV